MGKAIDIDNEIDNGEQEYEELVPSRTVQFWTILVFQIPSLACTIYLLCHLIFDKKLRKLLHNHVVIILLLLTFVINVIDNSLYLDAYRHQGRSSFPPSPFVCLLWIYVDYGFYGAVTVFLAWASFERHILIFHYHRFLRSKIKRILFHYLPLCLLLIYMIGFYLGILIFPPCENIFQYDLEVCGMEPCYEHVSWLNLWDYLINGTMCTLIEAICSVSLLVRVLHKRCRAHRSLRWKKHRKMTIQLLSISALSLSITLPQTLITAVQQIVPGMDDFGSDVAPYFFYLTTYVVLFLPFVALASFPELLPKLPNLRRRRQHVVVPFTVAPATVRKYSDVRRPHI